jgi:hypothetical protein
MVYSHIFSALIIAFIVILIISFSTKRPLRGLWIFFVILFLATWMGQLWITPAGPLFWGVPWIPLIGIPLFIALLLLALISGPAPQNKKPAKNLQPETRNQEPETVEAPLIALGFFFWILVTLMIIAIATGYYRWVYFAPMR